MQSKRTRRKRKLGSYPFLSVTFSISLALLVLGIFGLLVLQTNKLTSIIQENIEFQVFLNNDLSNIEQSRIQRTISSKRYVLQKSGDPVIQFVGKDEAARQFVEATGEDFSELLGENPLRDHFVVNINAEYQQLDSLEKVSTELSAIRGVFDVSYVETLVQSINQNLAKIGMVLSGVALILFLVVIILINNTIKLALFSQRFLIRSMQLVGATGTFIKRPFLMRSMFYGALAGILANCILWLLYQSAAQRIPDLDMLYDSQNMLMLVIGVVLIGMFVAYLSTYLAVNRYLQTSLDDLY